MDDFGGARNREEWRPVVGYEGWYEVSNLGRVKRVRRGSGTRPGTILTPIRRPGCWTVALSRDAVEIVFRIHALVMEAFVGPRPPGLVINHIDADTLNNAVWNLEYVTQRENVHHTMRLGLRRLVGKHCKLNPDKVREIRKLVGTTTNVELGKRFGVSGSAIDRIANGEAWKTVV
jgi:hypothetical protein